MSHNGDQEDNVATSLGSARAALEHFEKGLRNSGMEEGREAYEAMAEILIGQRLWVESAGIERFETEFSAVAKSAAGIHRLLEPYTEVMRRLQTLPHLGSTESDGHDPEPEIPARETIDERLVRVLEVLEAASGPQGTTRVARTAGIATATARRRLDELVQLGLAEEVVLRGRRTYQPRSAL